MLGLLGHATDNLILRCHFNHERRFRMLHALKVPSRRLLRNVLASIADNLKRILQLLERMSDT